MVVSQDKMFQQLEKKTYLSYHQDGLLDLIIGLCILGFGFNMSTGSSAFLIFAWLPILLLIPLKNKITVPRLGYVKFGAKRASSQRTIAIISILVGVVFLVGILFLLSMRSHSPTMTAFVKRYHMLILGGIAAFAFSGAALMTGVKRLYLHAALMILIIASGIALSLEPPVYILILGAVIFAIGVIILVGFIRKYPVLAGE